MDPPESSEQQYMKILKSNLVINLSNFDFYSYLVWHRTTLVVNETIFSMLPLPFLSIGMQDNQDIFLGLQSKLTWIYSALDHPCYSWHILSSTKVLARSSIPTHWTWPTCELCLTGNFCNSSHLPLLTVSFSLTLMITVPTLLLLDADHCRISTIILVFDKIPARILYFKCTLMLMNFKLICLRWGQSLECKN